MSLTNKEVVDRARVSLLEFQKAVRFLIDADIDVNLTWSTTVQTMGRLELFDIDNFSLEARKTEIL